MKLKGIRLFGISGFLMLSILFISESCTTAPKGTQQKPGALLWGENCVRCHNGPSPTAFSDVQWETIAMHMRVRASLTAVETEKVVEFLKMAN
ncbi:MAG: cytochrome c [Calditrichaeota bacterium]|nr:MAG: cytochrome c [Calditrichota bacterium]MBL1207193.1 cytochrome c [Calditrichota bacterium]NOG47026.1 cytochrome c [Calditrichota bacterium]